MNNSSLDHILNCHPIVKTDIVYGSNTTLQDVAGKSITDFEAGIWCTALGYNHPRIQAVMLAQINKIIHLHNKLTSQSAEILAKRLVELFDFESGKAVFLCSGSEAVQLAIRLAKVSSKKGKLLTFSTAYLSAYGLQKDNDWWVEIDYLNCSSCEAACNKSCPVFKNIQFEDISTLVLEPATCGRVLFPPAKLVRFLTNEIKVRGGIIVANEVTTGLGRTGMWFGYNHFNIEADIIALGKGLGNGYPISAVVMNKEIADAVEENKFVYVQSHQNDPLGCTIAAEVLDVLQQEALISRSKSLGDNFLSQLKTSLGAHPLVKDIRGRGLMIAIELNKPNITDNIFHRMLDKGYFIGTTDAWNILRFFPALTIHEDSISQMIKELNQILNEY